MTETPWLTIIGLGEDAPDGLSGASRSALEQAEIIMGPPRHLGLLPETAARQVPWPVPFADGIKQLLSFRGRRVVALASGDPFWFGAGTSVTRHLKPDEWRAIPGCPTFTLAAARIGWPLEETGCFGLHAAPLSRLRTQLAPGRRMIVLLRDGSAVRDLSEYLCAAGFSDSVLAICEALGGPRERITRCTADDLPDREFAHPVCAGVEVAGTGEILPLATGRPDAWFDSDGTMTKQPVRALTLSALSPRPFEHLWDIGGGSGSIGIEWLMCHPSLQATVIEPRDDRGDRIRANAKRLGQDRLDIRIGSAPDALPDLARPDAVFIGGGLSEALLDWLHQHLRPGTRIVANAVTLESEALLTRAHAGIGGTLTRIEIARAEALGPRTGWKSAYPLVQWAVTL